MPVTNETISLMRAHRSIRRFTNAPVPDEAIVEAVGAAQCASTSSNVQAYCLIRVRDEQARQRLVELAGNQPYVGQAGAFFVVCGDTTRHRLLTRRAGHTYRGGLEEFLVGAIDASLFAQNLVLAFEAKGYGCCYIGGLRNDLEQVDQLLQLPEGAYPLFGLCVGTADQDPPIRPRLPVHAVLFDDRYPDDEVMLGMIETYDEQMRAYLKARSNADRDWSGPIAERCARPRREQLAAYYRVKGANLG